MNHNWFSENAEVVSNEPIDQTMYKLTLRAPQIASTAAPGQFVFVLAGGFDNYELVLPRPFDLHWADPQEDQIQVIYRVKGRGTKVLSLLSAGDPVGVNGPFGKRVDTFFHPYQHVALIGRGSGISPLYFIAHHAHKVGANVSAYLSARSENLLQPFVSLADIARVTTQTDDLQAGVLVTDFLKQDLVSNPPDLAFVVGSQRLARAALALGGTHKFPVYGFTESYMGCGFGHCKGCAVATNHGYVLACLEGPVMDLREVNDAYWANIPT